MAATLQATALLANDPLFRARVQAAMVTAGINVAAEAVGVMDADTYALRHQLAVAVLNAPTLQLDKFAWAVAANVTVAGDLGPVIAIASSTAANPSLVTTSSVHGLATGDWVEIVGHLANTAINGSYQVTVTTTTAFTVPILGNGVGGATGYVQRQPPDADVQFAVNSNFGNIAGVGVKT